MTVEYIDPDAGFTAILNDAAFSELIDIVVRDDRVLLVIAEVIKQYHSDQHLNGDSGRVPIEQFVSTFAPRLRSRNAAARIAAAFRSLFVAHDPHHVRGAVLEGLVEQRLRSRYSGAGEDLLNNHKIRCSNDDHPDYESSTTIDVIGFDHTVGECHDCKVAAKDFRSSFITEMETNLVPRRFKIGMVTTDSQAQARVAFTRKSFQPRFAQVIPLEMLWRMAPLQVA